VSFEDELETGGQIASQSHRRHGRLVPNGVEDNGVCVALEEPLAYRHFIQNHSDGEQIRAGVQLLAAPCSGDM